MIRISIQVDDALEILALQDVQKRAMGVGFKIFQVPVALSCFKAIPSPIFYTPAGAGQSALHQVHDVS